MLPHKIALCFALALAALTLAAQTPERTPVLRHAPESFERVAELYAASPAEATALDGGVILFDVNGQPVEGARVAVLATLTPNAALEVLECGTSDAEGRVSLEARRRATTLAIWDHEHPPRKITDGRLDRHRELAGNGAFLVELGNAEVVAGHVQLDGKPAPEGFELTLGIGGGTARITSFSRAEAKLLAPFGAPTEPVHVTTDANGDYRFSALRFPRFSPTRVRPLYLRWSAENVFRGLLHDPWNEKYMSRWSRGSVTVPGQASSLDLELTTGRWVSGHVVGPDGSPLDQTAELRFTSPGSKPGSEEVRTFADHSFRFAVPSDATELDITLVLDEKTLGSPLHFEAPTDSSEWLLGELQIQAPDAVTVTVLDDRGEPLRSAAVRWCDASGRDLALSAGEPLFSPSVTWLDTEHTGESGRLLIQRPPAGDGLLVLRSGFEPRAVFDLPQDASKPLEIQLRKSAQLRIVGAFPGAFPDARLIVQIEADRPAVRLYEGMRRSSAEEAESALSTWIPARSLDEASRAAWSYSQPFLPYARWPASLNAEPTRTACIISEILPGVPMHVRVLDPTGKVFYKSNLEVFSPGETRELNFTPAPPLADLSGRVLDAAGLPVAEATVHFGALALAPVATTDDAGRFTIDSPFATSGPLRIERAGSWIACGLWSGGGGRTPYTLFFDEDFTFDPAGEAEIILPERSRLDIHLADFEGQPFDGEPDVRLMTSSGGRLLSSEVSLVGDEDPNRVFFRPAGISCRVAIDVGSMHIERLAPASTNELTIALPSLGSILVNTGPGFVTMSFGANERYRLIPHDGSPTAWRSVYLMENTPDELRELRPGTYTLQLFRADMDDPALMPIGPAVEVEVRANETTKIAYVR